MQTILAGIFGSIGIVIVLLIFGAIAFGIARTFLRIAIGSAMVCEKAVNVADDDDEEEPDDECRECGNR